VQLGLVVEGQDGLDWARWREIIAMAEGHGFASLFRSDHIFVGNQQESLEAYVSLTLAAAESSTVRIGPLVSPVTFRSPSELARMAASIDVLSGGRFVLGLGIGWYEEEHRAYGIPFPPVGERFDRLQECIEVCRALWAANPATYDGEYYKLRDADCLPRPTNGTIPVLIGGVGEKRALRIVATYADEWCSECLSVEDYAHKVNVLERHCETVNRDPATIRRSMVVYGDVVPSMRRIARGVAKRALDVTGVRTSAPQPFEPRGRAGGFVIGGRQQIVERLGEYAALGLQEAIFRYEDFDRTITPDYLASEILPAVRSI
jgi:F420-dependent oxidoreductase-like protein